MVEVVPDTWGKQELVGEGVTKMSDIGWPKTSPACGGWRASPLLSIMARARVWLTRKGQDQVAAWHDGDEPDMSQTWTLCRTSSTSSLETFAVMVLAGLGRITAQQVVDDDGVDFRGRCQHSSNGGKLELSQLWKLCRTSSTSSPAEEARSKAHNVRGSYSMRYMKPSW